MVTFKKDYTVFLEDNKDFVFKNGYAYKSAQPHEDYIVVYSIDESIKIVLSKEEQERYLA